MVETKDIGIALPRLSIYYDFPVKVAFKELQPLMLASPGTHTQSWRGLLHFSEIKTSPSVRTWLRGWNLF